jgi:hypothetical protein
MMRWQAGLPVSGVGGTLGAGGVWGGQDDEDDERGGGFRPRFIRKIDCRYRSYW